MSGALRVVVVDDERPARRVLVALLRGYDDVALVGEAADGAAAVDTIERERPELVLLDLQMPEMGGLDVVRALPRDRMPLIAFVTAYEEYAVPAFEVDAIDYLLKPVDPVRLRRTIGRAHERLEQADLRDASGARGGTSPCGAGVREASERGDRPEPSARPLRRIPVRLRDGDVVLVPVADVAAIVADGETLHLLTRSGERHTITYRLKDIAARVDPARFVRLSRSSLVAVDAIAAVRPKPGGTCVVHLRTGHWLRMSRIRARVLREELLRL